MKRERLLVNDTSKLEGLGFAYSPPDEYFGDRWRYSGLTVNEKGFLSILSIKADTIMKLIELGKLGLVERMAMTKKVNVTMTDEEYEDFKKWKEKRK